MKGYTTLFTTKGYFTKAPVGNNLVKLREDALLEFPAFLFGQQIGVSVAECSLSSHYVNIKLFTSNSVSLVHAAELKKYFDTVDEVYNDFLKLGRVDIVRDLQRMYIFNYLIGNPDLHDENTGFLYDARTFEILRVCPCFDHNIAFNVAFKGVSRATKRGSKLLPLDDWTKQFIPNHPDIVLKLKNVDYVEIGKYLNKQQIKELRDRVNQTIAWSK